MGFFDDKPFLHAAAGVAFVIYNQRNAPTIENLAPKIGIQGCHPEKAIALQKLEMEYSSSSHNDPFFGILWQCIIDGHYRDF